MNRQTPNTGARPCPPPPAPRDPAWFIHDRFGLFIHWGSTPPRPTNGSRTANAPDDTHYDRYFRHFDPDLYDPAACARDARAAGMQYVVLTTKHHEGFCLWDSALTDYKATNTPPGATSSAPRRCLPRGRLQDRLLPLTDRLAPPRLHRRCRPPPARRRCRPRRQR
ncbi:MAG: alpha-L-fucosidase [Thermomicrobiales bacterium]